LHKEPDIDTKLHASGFFKAFRHQGRKSGSNDQQRSSVQVLWRQDFSSCENLSCKIVVLCVPACTYPCISNQTQIKTHTFKLCLQVYSAQCTPECWDWKTRISL